MNAPSTTSCSVTIDQGSLHHRDTVQRLVYGFLKRYGIDPDPLRWEAHIEQFGANGPAVHEFVMLREGELIGVTTLRTESVQVGIVSDLYVAENLRGKGYGGILYDFVIRKARSLGFHLLRCETRSEFKGAVRLLERSGWRREADPAPIPGQVCPDRAYSLELSGARCLSATNTRPRSNEPPHI